MTDRLCHALGNLTRERIGAQKDVAKALGVSVAYVSALLAGKKSITAGQLNRILDACGSSDEERFALNAWGARESGWRLS